MLGQLGARHLGQQRAEVAPGAQGRGHVVDLLHAAQHLGGAIGNAVDDHGVSPCRLDLVELRGHVGVFGAVLLDRHGFNAVQRQNLSRILDAALAVAGGIRQDGDLLVLRGLDGIGAEQGHLLAVHHRDAVEVVLRLFGVAGGDFGGGADGHDHRDLLLLRNMQPGQRIARVGRAHDAADLFAVDQLLHGLDGLGRGALVIAHHADQFAAHDAAGFIDVFNSGFKTPAPRDTQLGHAAGRLVGGVADLDVLGLCRKRQSAGHQCRSLRQTIDELVHVCLLALLSKSSWSAPTARTRPLSSSI